MLEWKLGYNGMWLYKDGKNIGMIATIVNSPAQLSKIEYHWYELINGLDDNYGGVEPTLALAASALLDWLKRRNHI